MRAGRRSSQAHVSIAGEGLIGGLPLFAEGHEVEEKTKDSARKEIKFRHGVLAFGLLAVAMLGCVVGLGTEPQIPMVIGCAIAAGIAMYLGFRWDEVVDFMMRGILDAMEAVLILMCIGMLVGAWIVSGTVPTLIYYGFRWDEVVDFMMRGILDAMEAVLILMCIGMLVGAWIVSGTVPTLIYYGLSVISPQLFLPIAFLGTLLVGIVLGSWGAAGTIGIAFMGIAAALDIPLGMAAGAIIAGAYVSEIASPGIVLGSWGAAGTIGIAFMGIAAALDIPLGMAAGAIIAGAYVSEIASPLTDGPVLCAALANVSVFSLCKRFLPLVVAVCLISTGLYFLIGNSLGAGMTEAGTSRVEELLFALDQSYAIGPLTLIPLFVMIVCIAVQVPAIPSFLLGVLLAVVEAVVLQGAHPGVAVEAANSGVVSATGFSMLDELLSTGGIVEMLPTISIVILVMAYVGIMQHTGLIQSLVEPITSRLRSFSSLAVATVGSGAAFNILMPDQYPSIAMSSKMYGGALVEPITSRLRSFSSLAVATVGSGAAFNILMPDQYPSIAMSSKMYGGALAKHGVAGEVWSNIVNSSAGITSVLVPWNTCSIYMVTILGVSCIEYLPFAFFCYLYPTAVAVNSSAGITSVLVPWNTCSIYMVTILGVSCIEYLPFAFFCYLYPTAVAAMAVLFGRKLGWSARTSGEGAL